MKRPLALFIATISLCTCMRKQAAEIPAPQQSWQDGFVLDHTSHTAGSETSAVVVGWLHVAAGGAASRPIIVNQYRIASNGIIYTIACLPTTQEHPCPNVTVHHRAIVSVDSTILHVLDDDGVEQKVAIVDKTAERKAPSELP